jgi:hypothetical protein
VLDADADLLPCRVTDVHPSLTDGATLEEMPHTVVFVYVSCPSHD